MHQRRLVRERRARDRSAAGAYLVLPALYWFLLLLFVAAPAKAQVIHDDFAGSKISSENWFVCHRDENSFTVRQSAVDGHNAVDTMVYARGMLATLGLSLAHSECHRDDSPADKNERAEIWEADAVRQKFGTDVWYRFSMYIDPSVPAATRHLVIGQWKEAVPGDHSPFVAQRFNGGIFTITVETDNDDPGRAPEDDECRIVVAADAAGSSSALAVGASAGHDYLDLSHGPTIAEPTQPVPKPCAGDDVKVERFDVLPNPFGHWVTMTYHIRGGAVNGLVEIWADDRLISRTTGRIGFRQSEPRTLQYFKFGPYRQHDQEVATYALMAKYARGYRQSDLR